MKQHHLSTKFLRFYILIGILGFFLITLGGSYMVEKHLEHSLSAALYTEAHNIASNEAVKSNILTSVIQSHWKNSMLPNGEATIIRLESFMVSLKQII